MVLLPDESPLLGKRTRELQHFDRIEWLLLERKLQHFRKYYNHDRVHASLDGLTPACKAAAANHSVISLNDYQWRSHCRGLYQLPIAA